MGRTTGGKMKDLIKPLDSWMTDDCIIIYDDKQVEELEQNYREAVDALIEDVSSTAAFIESMPNITFMDDSIAKHISRIELLERLTGISWAELKEE